LPVQQHGPCQYGACAFGWGDPGVSFTAVIQLGSIAAILWCFWDDLYAVTRNTITAIIARDFDS